MEELEYRIIELLEKNNKNFSLEEINRDLGANVNIVDLQKAIENLECEGRIFRNKKDRFSIWHKGLNRLFGVIKITKRGMGIFNDENGNVTLVPKSFLNGALSGDKVIIYDMKKVKNRQEGRVERVVARKKDSIVCEVVESIGQKDVKPVADNAELKLHIRRSDLENYFIGDRLLIEIGEERSNGTYNGSILKRICHKDDPNSDLITIAAVHGFDSDFPKEVQDEVKEIPRDISNEDISDRVDLRNKVIFTIDGEETKDIDDAVSLEILPNGNYKLGVHIADVSHYVKPGTAIFEEAIKRGTSVYMINSVIPMLPRELSNGICSLNPNEDRLAKTCEMEIDKDGNIISSQIFDSVIRSRKKMNYTAVNQIIEEDIVPEGYEQFADILKEMNELSKKMNANRFMRGAIEFISQEMKIKTDIKGRPYEIGKEIQRDAENLIENFMLAANETVATYLSSTNLPSIYRVHAVPNITKLASIIQKICHANKQVENITGDITSSINIQNFLESLKNYRGYEVFTNMVKKGMSKAEYSVTNIGHYGLALTNYTHFTSPIRRCPDLLVHHLLNMHQKGKAGSVNMKELHNRLAQIALQNSESEREAQRAEFEANDMKAAEYMMDHIGEEYEAIVTSINQKGMYVQLDNLVEGEVKISDIEPKSYQTFDHSRYCLSSENGEYNIGDRINVRVKEANKYSRSINFTAMGHIKHHDSKEKNKTKELTYRQK